MEIGTTVRIWRYPVKSLRGESLESAEVRADGVAGDRTRALVVEDGHARTGKTYRGKEHNRLHLIDDQSGAVKLAEERGVKVRVANDEPHYFDDAPISILVDRWLDEVSAQMGYALGAERFRPNFFVRADPEFTAPEEALTGRELRLGEVQLLVRSPIVRCVTTTYDQTTGESDARLLRVLAEQRSSWIGIYCDVLRTGTVRIGDSLAYAER